jgi:hypothetical protein
MLAVGAIVLLVGVLALVGGGLQKLRAGRIAKTPVARTGDILSKGAAVAGEKGAISTEGKVAASQLVTAPVTGTQCLYYETEVVAKWKKGDQTVTQRVVHERVAAPFTVDDGSGAVGIDASKGGDFDTKQAFRRTQSRGLMSAITGKPLTFGENGFSIPMGMRVNNVIIPDSADFEVTEKVFEVPSHLYVNGKLDEQNRIGSPSWTALILSTKSRDELLSGTATMSKRLLIGGAAAGSIGAVLSAVGALMQ